MDAVLSDSLNLLYIFQSAQQLCRLDRMTVPAMFAHTCFKTRLSLWITTCRGVRSFEVLLKSAFFVCRKGTSLESLVRVALTWSHVSQKSAASHSKRRFDASSRAT